MKLVAEIDADELSCRIAEACIGVKRPKGTSARQALASFDEETRTGFFKAAEIAVEYITSCINAAGKVN